MSDITITKFGMQSCGPCRLLASSAWPRLAEANKDIVFESIDADKDPSTMTANKITSVPTVIFKKNGTEHYRIIGAKRQQDYQDVIDKLKKTP